MATAGGHSAVLTPEPGRTTPRSSSALSVERGLPPRAATIALATAYQETGIRNLDYGDRDSVGLFQQRPSQGWGTEKQLMDPYYATQQVLQRAGQDQELANRDITDVAQAVQRSAYPEAYRDHEADARVVASALTGQSPARLQLSGPERTPASRPAWSRR